MEFKRIFTIILLFTVSLYLSSCTEDTASPEPENTLKIGALLPMTGQFSTQGSCFLSALRLAVADVNDEFEASGNNSRVELIWADTQTDATAAKSLLGSYINQNIRMVIGPVTSSEVLGIKDMVDAADCILISPSSSMTELEIANDHIFRMVSSDSRTVLAITEAMWSEGIRNVITFYRDDEWGTSISANMTNAFIAKGGTSIGNVDYYSFRQSVMEESLDSLRNMITAYAVNGAIEELAIHFTSYDEGTVLFGMMNNDNLLSSVKWYGSDGFVNNNELLADSEARAFAEKVEYKAPIFGIEESQAFTDLVTRITNETSVVPGVYPVLAYEALMIAAETLDEAVENETIAQTAEKLRTNITSYNCMTGDISINEYDDRSNGSYYFWKVVNNAGTFEWQHVLTYKDGTIQ